MSTRWYAPPRRRLDRRRARSMRIRRIASAAAEKNGRGSGSLDFLNPRGATTLHEPGRSVEVFGRVARGPSCEPPMRAILRKPTQAAYQRPWGRPVPLLPTIGLPHPHPTKVKVQPKSITDVRQKPT